MAIAAFGAVRGGSPAAGQPGAEQPSPPTLAAITRPEGYAPTAVEAGTVMISPANRGSGREASSPQANGGIEGEPLGAEAVIGPRDLRQRVLDTTTYPTRAIGQIEGFDTLVGGYTCTGWLIDRNTILTSGHCVYPRPGNLAESLEFAPGRRGGTDPYGSCFGTNAFAPAAWVNDANEYADYAVVHLDCAIGDTVGWLGYIAEPGRQALRHRRAIVQGYPGDKLPQGSQWRMEDRIEASHWRMAFYDIDTAGGQSGSPVYYWRNACAGPCGLAVHSFGFHGGGTHGLYNHGPRITSARFRLIADIADNNG